jgi:hypothetical protein
MSLQSICVCVWCSLLSETLSWLYSMCMSWNIKETTGWIVLILSILISNKVVLYWRPWRDLVCMYHELSIWLYKWATYDLNILTESSAGSYVYCIMMYTLPSLARGNVNVFCIIFIVMFLAMWLRDPDAWRSQWIVLTSAGLNRSCSRNCILFRHCRHRACSVPRGGLLLR